MKVTTTVVLPAGRRKKFAIPDLTDEFMIPVSFEIFMRTTSSSRNSKSNASTDAEVDEQKSVPAKDIRFNVWVGKNGVTQMSKAWFALSNEVDLSEYRQSHLDSGQPMTIELENNSSHHRTYTVDTYYEVSSGKLLYQNVTDKFSEICSTVAACGRICRLVFIANRSVPKLHLMSTFCKEPEKNEADIEWFDTLTSEEQEQDEEEEGGEKKFIHEFDFTALDPPMKIYTRHLEHMVVDIPKDGNDKLELAVLAYGYDKPGHR